MAQVNRMFPNPEPEDLEPKGGKEHSDNVLQLAQELIQALDVESNKHMQHLSAEAKLLENMEPS